VLQLLDKPNLN